MAREFRTIEKSSRGSTLRALRRGSWKVIRFDDVYYRYPGATQDALSGVSFRIERGQSVALVGRSGAGKTTVADLLLGLLSPSSGHIEFEGASGANGSADESIMGYVPQPSYLLDDSVRKNVAFGADEAQIDDVLVSRSLEAVRMKERGGTNGRTTRVPGGS